MNRVRNGPVEIKMCAASNGKRHVWQGRFNSVFASVRDKLKQLHDIYKRQTNTEECFDSVDDDTIMECLLTVEASVFYNAKKNVLSVKEKDN